jgi:hypothetical protein
MEARDVLVVNNEKRYDELPTPESLGYLGSEWALTDVATLVHEMIVARGRPFLYIPTSESQLDQSCACVPNTRSVFTRYRCDDGSFKYLGNYDTRSKT